ncbi:putative CRISPR-associated protein [Moraxella atlantae]|uniref:Uncharacterized protein conserved in archaea n=2 Tax=Faucicola atlantae TaxID=34059 RepID=A0A378Q4K5_9GAMM|nr:putative CRISPR-associated protein [Moraxella atlantae]STY95118.1 Uncharacterized protein conserved in archaea [Moraxella atlantae]
MANFILSTCGTSVLTNQASSDVRNNITRYSNTVEWSAIPDDIAIHLQDHIEERKSTLLAMKDLREIKRMSAELNGLLAWQNQSNTTPQDIYYLLATDTLMGQATADIISQWLKNQGYQCQIINSSGLRTSQLASFREALTGLARQLIEIIDGYKTSGYQIYFNLTGGFKSLNGFLQAIASIYADQAFYLFEGSSELLFIPQLPFKLDSKVIEKNLVAFRRLVNDLAIQPEQLAQIPDSLLFDLAGQTILSEWGELLWLSQKNALYSEKLQESISGKIIFMPEFYDSIKAMPNHLIPKLNTTIDQLAVFAENPNNPNLRSLDAKPLKEQQYRDKGYWECDIDGNHYRIFMIKEGDSFKLQKAGEALHKSKSTI